MQRKRAKSKEKAPMKRSKPFPPSPSATSPPRPSVPNSSPSKPNSTPTAAGTEYTFRYGETIAYEGGTSSLGTLAARRRICSDGRPRGHLHRPQAEHDYHYQLKVENSYGEEVEPDQTFTTELSVRRRTRRRRLPRTALSHGEPNSTIREENNSLALPDCRAYEQVTERLKRTAARPLPRLLASPSGERVYYFSEGVFAGAGQNASPSSTSPTARQPAGSPSRGRPPRPAAHRTARRLELMHSELESLALHRGHGPTAPKKP